MKGGRDILGEYGHDVPHPQAPRATSGGITRAEPLRYSPPVGPTQHMHHNKPGLGGEGGITHEHKQQMHAHQTSGSPGLHGCTNHGNKGSQRG